MGRGGVDDARLLAGGIVGCVCMVCLFLFGIPMFFSGVAMLYMGSQVTCFTYDNDYWGTSSGTCDNSYYYTVGAVLIVLSILLLIGAIVFTVLACKARSNKRSTAPQQGVILTPGTATYGATVQPQPGYQPQQPQPYGYGPPQPGYDQPQPGYGPPQPQPGYVDPAQAMPGYVPPGPGYAPYPPQQQAAPLQDNQAAPPPAYEALSQPPQ